MKLNAKPSSLVLLVFLLIVAAMLAIVLKSGKERPLGDIQSFENYQRADVAEGFPKNGKLPAFDPRFVRLSAFERALIPDAPRLTAPLGTESGAFSYNAQPFWSLNSRRGGHHSGDDLNGIGGMNTDLGDPVFSIGNGRVIFAGEGSPGWGKIVLVAHKVDGQIIQSMYAHLENISVSKGQSLGRGQQLGTVGTANGQYLAHLHFELRDATTVDILRGYLAEKGVHLSPRAIIPQYEGEGGPVGPSSAMNVLKKAKAKNSVELPIEVLQRLR